MENRTIVMLVMLVSLVSACVQKTYRKTVVFTLHTENQKGIKTVGLRGEGNPLSWRKDSLMNELVKDSLYQLTITGVTGFKFTEVKFTINGEFELQEKPNRRVVFAEGDTTFYEAIFDEESK